MFQKIIQLKKDSTRPIAQLLITTLINVVCGTLLILFLWGVFCNDASYKWIWEVYTLRNLREIRSLPHAPLDQRLTMKLGEDYQYLLYIRNATPTNAVIYYPSRTDFTTPENSESPKPPFSGRLNDKLTAIRVLYPRRVVTADEYGITLWSKRITHICIVNGHNKEKIPYHIPNDISAGVLPIDSTLTNI